MRGRGDSIRAAPDNETLSALVFRSNSAQLVTVYPFLVLQSAIPSLAGLCGVGWHGMGSFGFDVRVRGVMVREQPCRSCG